MSKFGVVYSVSSWLPVTMTWIYTQIKYLRDFSPLILADTLDGIDRLPNYPVHAIPNWVERRSLQKLRQVGIRVTPKIYHDALKEFHPTVLHSHFGNQGWYDLPMAQQYALRQVVTYYGYDLSHLPAAHPIWKKRYKQLFEQASLFLLEGEFMAHTLAELGCPSEKIKVQHLGIDLEDIQFKPRVLQESENIRVLIAGRFVEKKGIPDAIRAIGILREQYPDIEVTVIGDSNGSSQGEREKARIHETIRAYKLESVIKLLGFQPVRVLMEQAYQHHIFLSPSVVSSNGDTEGGVPVSIIEMLASGMAVVSTYHCDIPGVIQHGISGLLAEEHQPEELAHHMKWLIENPHAWPGMFDAGRKHVEQKFNARVQGQRLMAIYEELAQQ